MQQRYFTAIIEGGSKLGYGVYFPDRRIRVRVDSRRWRALPCRRDRARRIRVARLGRHLLPVNPLTLL